MSRLATADIRTVASTLDKYDAELISKTRCTLQEIACRAVGVDENSFSNIVASYIVAVVPMTCGLGVIEGFADTVRAILRHIGVEAYSTRGVDVAGLAEAFERKANVIMVADDNRFVAINTKSGRVVDNADATGKGYVSALSQMIDGVKGDRVLVIGCGQVGRASATALVGFGAEVSVYDVDRHRCQDFARELRRSSNGEIRVEEELNGALVRHRRLIDASPAENIIDEQHVSPDSIVCAPGVPHGLSPGALKRISHRFIHDPLQIGVATMIVDAVR
ncbi:MAG: 3-methylornithyl-N6-L-lysine dehydrogenase PylD [Deltaproteobacteria bacterium]|nr:3-methylornithyl-N6-L-lysine dehydrogenase PylD [Deltaproteobacteria bacterium]